MWYGVSLCICLEVETLCCMAVFPRDCSIHTPHLWMQANCDLQIRHGICIICVVFNLYAYFMMLVVPLGLFISE